MEESGSVVDENVIHPKEKANFLSRALYLWAIPLLFKHEDPKYYRPMDELNSFKLSQRLENEWIHQCKICKSPSLLRVFFNLFRKELILSGFFYGAAKVAVIILQPVLFSQMLAYFTPDQTKLSASEGLYYILGIIGLQLYQSISFQFVHIVLSKIGLQFREAITSVIYRKSINLTKSQLDEITSIAQVIHFISVDAVWIDVGLAQIHQLWIAPIEVLIAAICLYLQFEWSGIIGLSIFVFVIFYQIVANILSNYYKDKRAAANEDRIQLLNELITGIQIIKMYAWENQFKSLILAAKRRELHFTKILTYVKVTTGSFKNFIATWSMCITIVVASFSKISLTPNFVFVTYIYYNILRNSIGSQFSLALVLFHNLKNSVDRIEDYFKLTMQNNTFSPNIVSGNNKTNVSINFKNVIVKWNIKQKENCLIDVNFSPEPKTLTAIVGSSGSGKSALLLTILRETCIVQGSLSVEGKISYASQEPWIFPASIRQNILFGEDFENEKFWNVIKACGLEHDLSMFPHGDLSLVGERGVLLSGGQKARINLARAVYKEADIYLLDDPLSAVDSYVAKHIFEKCILTFLSGKTVLLVTHQVHILSTIQKIYSIKDGRIKCQKLTNTLTKITNVLNMQAINDAEEEEMKKLKIKNFKIPKEASETDQSVHVIKDVYRFFMDAKNYYTFILFTAVFILAQFLTNGSDYCMNFWINTSQQNLLNASSDNTVSAESSNFITDDNFLYVYTAIVLGGGICSVFRAILMGYLVYKASGTLHYLVLQKIICATMTFFNTQKSGMILNKFSADMALVDQYFPLYFMEVLQSILYFIGAIILICVIDYIFVIPSLVYVGFLGLVLYRLQPIMNAFKTKELLTKSPILTHVVVTMQGAISVRALNAKEIIMKEFDEIMSINCVASYLKIVVTSLIGFLIDLLCLLYMAFVLLFFYFFQTDFYGSVGTIVIQIISLVGIAQAFIKITTEFNLTTLSLSRIQEYKNAPTEVDDGKRVLPKPWPHEGKIKFTSICLQYSPNTPQVLQNIRAEIEPMQKIGIIGRTGSGKSSLISILFRLYDFTGTIIIDGVDIKQIPLKDLRSRIAIIPQNPILFFGSLRRNLDPFNDYSDEQIWQALDAVEMKQIVYGLPNSFETRVQESGSNFSCGQRQLLCLARAILQKSKILILDEVTANIDLKTDQIMQTTIRKKFKDSTLLTIAHRLYTVIDSDKMLVLNDGCMVEFDHPYLLLQKPNGFFYQQVHQNGKEMTEELTNLAHKSFIKTLERGATEAESTLM